MALVFLMLSGVLLPLQVLGPTYIEAESALAMISTGFLPGIPLPILTVLQVVLLVYAIYLSVMLGITRRT